MHQGYVKPMLLDFKIPDITVNFKAKDKSIKKLKKSSKLPNKNRIMTILGFC